MTIVLILITYQDWTERKIHNLYVILMLLLGIVRGCCIQRWSWLEQLLGFVSVSGPMLLVNQIFPHSFGVGDIKVTGAAGVFLGARKMWSAFCISVLFAATYIIFVKALQKEKHKDVIAFGPFLSIGIFLCML